MPHTSSHRCGAARTVPAWLPALAVLFAVLAPPAAAQDVLPTSSSSAPITLTLSEAVQIALVQNYTIRNNRLDVRESDAQIREAWGDLMPNISASSSYTRNVKTANPFAGSQAGNLFGSLGFLDWLAYNEQARTDGDAATNPINFLEFQSRQFEGLREAGIEVGGSDNPFGVENQFQNSVTVNQTLFSGSALLALSAAKYLKAFNQRAVERQEQLLINDVRQSFYQALLAQEQQEVVGQSVSRTRATLTEVARQVAQGVAPKYQRLSAEVQLANLETQLMQTQNQASSAVDNLKFTLGIPVNQPVRLRGDLEVETPNPYLTVSVQNAYDLALDRRPDLEQARIGVTLRDLDRKRTLTQYFPELTAFANIGYGAGVPDNRTFYFSSPTDPFTFQTEETPFFSSSYWQSSVSVGFRLSWTLFDGLKTHAQIQQRKVARQRAELQYEQLRESVRLEVATALRNLETASQQILSQQRNVERAELNYQHASARLREGVATQLEERDASEQLDQSRINYLQAVYDYLVARSAFETAAGIPLAQQSDIKLTSIE